MQHHWGCFGKFTREEIRAVEGRTREWFCSFSHDFPEQLKPLFQFPSGAIYHQVKSLQLDPELHKVPVMFSWTPAELRDSEYYAVGYLKTFPDTLHKDAFRLFLVLLPGNLYSERYAYHPFSLLRGNFLEEMWQEDPAKLAEMEFALPHIEVPSVVPEVEQFVATNWQHTLESGDTLLLEHHFGQWQQAHSAIECIFSCAPPELRKKLSFTTASGVKIITSFSIVGFPCVAEQPSWEIFSCYPPPLEEDINAIPDDSVLVQMEATAEEDMKKAAREQALSETGQKLSSLWRNAPWGKVIAGIVGLLLVLALSWSLLQQDTPEGLTFAVRETFAGEGDFQQQLKEIIAVAREKQIVIPAIDTLEKVANYHTSDRETAKIFWQEVGTRTWSEYSNIGRCLAAILRREQQYVLAVHEQNVPADLAATENQLQQLEEWKKLWQSLPLEVDIPQKFAEVQRRYSEIRVSQRQQQLLAMPLDAAIRTDLSGLPTEFFDELDGKVEQAMQSEWQPLAESAQCIREILVADGAMDKCEEVGATSAQFLLRWRGMKSAPLARSKQLYDQLVTRHYQWYQKLENFARRVEAYRSKVKLPQSLEEFATTEIDFVLLSATAFSSALESYQRLLVDKWGEWQSHERRLAKTENVAEFRDSLQFFAHFSLIGTGWSFFAGKSYSSNADKEAREVLQEVYRERQKLANIVHIELNFGEKKNRHEQLKQRLVPIVEQWEQLLIAAARHDEIPTISWPEGQYTEELQQSFTRLAEWLKNPEENSDWSSFGPDLASFLECYRDIDQNGYSHQVMQRLFALTSLSSEGWYSEYVLWLKNPFATHIEKLTQAIVDDQTGSFGEIAQLEKLHERRQRELTETITDLEKLLQFSGTSDTFVPLLTKTKELAQKFAAYLDIVQKFRQLRARFLSLPPLTTEEITTLSRLLEEYPQQLLFQENSQDANIAFRLENKSCELLRISADTPDGELDKSLSLYVQYPFLQKIPELQQRYEKVYSLVDKAQVIYRVFDELPVLTLKQKQLQDLIDWCLPHRPSAETPSLLKNSPAEIRRFMLKMFSGYTKSVFQKYVDEQDLLLVHRKVENNVFKRVILNIQRRGQALNDMAVPDNLPPQIKNFVEEQKKALTNIHFSVKYSVFGGVDISSIETVAFKGLEFYSPADGKKQKLLNVQMSYTTKLLGSITVSWYPFRSQGLRVRTSFKKGGKGNFSTWPFMDMLKLPIPHKNSEKEQKNKFEMADITLVLMPLEVEQDG